MEAALCRLFIAHLAVLINGKPVHQARGSGGCFSVSRRFYFSLLLAPSPLVSELNDCTSLVARLGLPGRLRRRRWDVAVERFAFVSETRRFHLGSGITSGDPKVEVRVRKIYISPLRCWFFADRCSSKGRCQQ
ncbi:hypothetical protein DPEC_G00251610 [Dallia pectoralis]|uniref:Uncharacterized protein n=1 Tax=Dallia pectoralis TaxID=75939 RepID=A0ACC2FT71_DALPE|nr:hypothetical protein DPEC_G00251610 [Dallia pectoralis]